MNILIFVIFVLLKAAEMWFYRRLLRVSWTGKRTNESILEELSNRQLLHEIDTRWLRYFRHANRNTATSLMSTVEMGKVEGKRRRARPPMSYISNIVNASVLKIPEMGHKNRDGRRRHDLTTSCGDSNRMSTPAKEKCER